MAKKDEQEQGQEAQASEEQHEPQAQEENATPDHGPEALADDQKDAEGEPRAASEGESAPAENDPVTNPLEMQVNPLTATEEQERAAAQAFPRKNAMATFDPADQEQLPARTGHAATSRSEIGRVITVDEDTEYEGEVYKAGTQQQPVDIAEGLIAEGLAFEPAGKQRGR